MMVLISNSHMCLINILTRIQICNVNFDVAYGYIDILADNMVLDLKHRLIYSYTVGILLINQLSLHMLFIIVRDWLVYLTVFSRQLFKTLK